MPKSELAAGGFKCALAVREAAVPNAGAEISLTVDVLSDWQAYTYTLTFIVRIFTRRKIVTQKVTVVVILML